MLLNGGGRGIVWLVLEVGEQAVGTVLGLLSCATFDVGTGIRNCFLEYRKYVLIVVAAGQEPLVEDDKLCLNVQWTQAQSVHAHHVARD